MFLLKKSVTQELDTGQFFGQLFKRLFIPIELAHSALERKRRDHIKESFTGLRDAVPTMHHGDKSSRAQILKKASDYISSMRKKNAREAMQ